MAVSRRAVLAGLGAAAASSAWRGHAAAAGPFNLSILTDEISQDFGHACEVASREFGMGYVDLRESGGKNIMKWDAAQIAEARRVLERFTLRVACIASPIFKVDWPGAPKSSFSPTRDEFGASFTYPQQQELLERAFELARDVQHRPDPHLRLLAPRGSEAAPRGDRRGGARGGGESRGARRSRWCSKTNMPATPRPAPKRRGCSPAIPEKALQLTWDPGNAQLRDEVPFPGGYARDSRKIASDTSTARTPCAARTARSGSGWRWATASSTGPGSSAR